MNKIELLIAFNTTNGDFKNKDNFLSLLAINGDYKIDSEEIIFKRSKYKYQIGVLEINEDEYNAFVLSIFTKKNDEKYRELIKIIKKTIGTHAKEKIYTLWDNMSMSLCSELYPQVNMVENLMRKLIFQFMFIKLGISWQSIAIPSNITETIKKKNSEKNTNIIYQLDFIHLASFLFTPYSIRKNEELSEIIEDLKKEDCNIEKNINSLKDFLPIDNWTRYFSSILDCESEQLNKKWKRLYEIRCTIAHNNFLNYVDFEEGEELCLYLQKILEEAINKLKEINVPEIEKESVSQQTINAVGQAYQDKINSNKRSGYTWSYSYPNSISNSIDFLNQADFLNKKNSSLMNLININDQYSLIRDQANFYGNILGNSYVESFRNIYDSLAFKDINSSYISEAETLGRIFDRKNISSEYIPDDEGNSSPIEKDSNNEIGNIDNEEDDKGCQ